MSEVIRNESWVNCAAGRAPGTEERAGTHSVGLRKQRRPPMRDIVACLRCLRDEDAYLPVVRRTWAQPDTSTPNARPVPPAPDGHSRALRRPLNVRRRLMR